MREIKFRIFDKLKNEILFEGFHVFGEVTLFNAIGHHAFETKGERSSLERYNDFILMQYTGLKDKNGKEIYEGDITKRDYVIMWSNKLALFCEHFYQSYGKKWVEASYPIDSDRIEVVGNMYEASESAVATPFPPHV